MSIATQNQQSPLLDVMGEARVIIEYNNEAVSFLIYTSLFFSFAPLLLFPHISLCVTNSHTEPTNSTTGRGGRGPSDHRIQQRSPIGTRSFLTSLFLHKQVKCFLECAQLLDFRFVSPSISFVYAQCLTD